jgi:hypothetical protein
LNSSSCGHVILRRAAPKNLPVMYPIVVEFLDRYLKE